MEKNKETKPLDKRKTCAKYFWKIIIRSCFNQFSVDEYYIDKSTWTCVIGSDIGSSGIPPWTVPTLEISFFFQISRVFQPKTLFRLEGTDFFRYRLRTSGPGPLAIRICQNLWLSSKLFYKCSRLTLQLIQQQKMKKKNCEWTHFNEPIYQWIKPEQRLTSTK